MIVFQKKAFRYYYWLVLEFFKKYGRLIAISFFVSFIAIIGFLSISPYIKIILTKEEVIGLVGRYDINNPPEELAARISNGLVSVSEKGEIIPVIANSWEVKQGGQEYRFHLKDNLLWGDGEKFSASDIKYQFADIKIKPVDERTIDFFLNKPLEIFPTYLNKPLLRYPLIGVAGYYKVGKIKTEYGYLKEVTLTPNTKNITPLRYRFYGSDSQLTDAYKKGEISQMTLTKKTVADTFLNWKNSTVSKSVDYTRLLTIFFNFNNPIFEEKDIREALSMLINTKKLSEFGELAKGPIPPNSWGYNPDLKDYVYDLETAGKIIEKGAPASSSAKLNFVTFFDYYDVADEFVSEIEKAGLSADLNVVSLDRPDNFDLFLAFLKIPADPDQYYFWHSTQKVGNIGSYKNVKVDLLLEKGRSTINIEEREKNYFDLQKAIQDDPPAIFLYYPYVYTIKRK
ncbi:MAG: Extracellular solute-binding protein family 5 [Candidatus Roizmanbacteria bacterium GW2011_GWC2_37_13]|uniref:Extracellular solute-binding protein family 5 n=1 Tax=Candidatus Roizmanbacteria bacterium GW2011_GWC2_37_13 TaxID=1618486 RepID=A0A0G0J9C8_9BACT|nr:MAG: Extracellular solute-binding protein family 5 [Candidatus Roizmanbacteria bacterium GW2011_GWC1_37_12]KKQ24716.1 MAG: Extracellular solute-binding protein family 5 [Candidatus Roizmanbacteria bacterium GW2011_GWC2_37_13]